MLLLLLLVGMAAGAIVTATTALDTAVAGTAALDTAIAATADDTTVAAIAVAARAASCSCNCSYCCARLSMKYCIHMRHVKHCKGTCKPVAQC
jgi:hypothetical protein